MATSYTNIGGSGVRYPLITVTSGGGFSPNGPINYLVSGGYSTGLFFNGITLTGTQYILFDFSGSYGVPQSVVIDEAKWYQNTTTAEGTWQWQGSPDNVTWTNIGATFTLGGVITQVMTTLNGNTTSYSYYRLLGLSGTTNSSPWQMGVDFKIDGYVQPFLATPQTNTSPVNVASYNWTWQTVATPIAPWTYSFDTGNSSPAIYQAEHPTVPYPYGNIAPGNPVPVGTTLGTGTVNVAYTETFTIQGGVAPFTYNIIAGSLPAGLVLNANGNITGTPTAVTTSVFTLQVTDAVTDSGSQQFTLQVQNASSGNVGGNYGWTK